MQHGLPFTVAGTYLLCNDDLFQQAGVTQAPRTWDDVRDVARLLTNKTGVAGISLPDSGDFWNLQTLLESNGARLLIKGESHYRAGIAAPEAIAAMQLYADMILKEKTALPTSWEQGVPMFISGQIAMFMGGAGVAPALRGAPISRWSQYRFRPSAISHVASRWRATTTSSSPPGQTSKQRHGPC